MNIPQVNHFGSQIPTQMTVIPNNCAELPFKLDTVTKCNQQESQMTFKLPELPLSPITHRNIVESTAQSMLREAAKCAELADRVLYGDGWALAGEPSGTSPRQMTKQASDLFASLERDVQSLLGTLPDLMTDPHIGSTPLTLALDQDESGWVKITDPSQAFFHEKKKARERWLANQAKVPQPEISARAEGLLAGLSVKNEEPAL